MLVGAERARRRARDFLRKNNHNTTNDHLQQQQRNHHYYGNARKVPTRTNFKLLPKRSLKPSERFYASLLQHDIQTILLSSSPSPSPVHSTNNHHDWKTFMTNTCEHTLNIPIPEQLPKVYRDNNEYYSKLSSLIIEEARCVLVDALHKKQQKKTTPLYKGKGKKSTCYFLSSSLE